jgi:hypothetical protein
MDYLEEEENRAIEELKRADHSVYVTLKYTKTADVMYNTLLRLINAFEISFNFLMEHLKEKKRIKEIPGSMKEKVEIIFKKFPKFKKYIKLYELFKEIEKAPYSGREEYRKHATIISRVSAKKIVEIDIPVLISYYNITKEFVRLVREIVE